VSITATKVIKKKGIGVVLKGTGMLGFKSILNR
jgi:hypothetical protein